MSDAESPLDPDDMLFNTAAESAVELGNQIAEHHQDSDLWEIADGILAGAVHYWLFARQPCSDPNCEDCANIATAELRLRELITQMQHAAQSSEYFHGTNDHDVGHA